MRTDPNQRRKHIETSEREKSPSAGWREVYAAMGVAPDGGAEAFETPERRGRSVDRDDPTEAESGRGAPARP